MATEVRVGSASGGVADEEAVTMTALRAACASAGPALAESAAGAAGEKDKAGDGGDGRKSAADEEVGQGKETTETGLPWLRTALGTSWGTKKVSAREGRRKGRMLARRFRRDLCLEVSQKTSTQTGGLMSLGSSLPSLFSLSF